MPLPSNVAAAVQQDRRKMDGAAWFPAWGPTAATTTDYPPYYIQGLVSDTDTVATVETVWGDDLPLPLAARTVYWGTIRRVKSLSVAANLDAAY